MQTGKRPPDLRDWPAPVLHLASTPSTQDVARKLAQEGSPPWSLVLADRQTRGRGRLGRKWISAKGGLYLSVILRPRLAPRRLGDMSLRIADAVARTLTAATGLPTTVKPPNDVLAARLVKPEFELLPADAGSRRLGHQSVPMGAFKKVCGILVEASGTSKRTDWVVLGIGVNVNNRIPAALPHAASLSRLAGRRFELRDIRRAVLDQLPAACGPSFIPKTSRSEGSENLSPE